MPTSAKKRDIFCLNFVFLKLCVKFKKLIQKAKFKRLKIFKKILFLAISSLFGFSALAQASEIKARELPFSYTSIGAEPNFGRYDSKQVATKDRQNLINTAKWADRSSTWIVS